MATKKPVDDSATSTPESADRGETGESEGASSEMASSGASGGSSGGSSAASGLQAWMKKRGA